MNILKPIAKPHRVPVLQRLTGVGLTLAADELLLEKAEILSEGDKQTEPDGTALYHGSTMVTIDLRRHDLELGPAEKSPTLLLAAVKSSVLFRLQLMRLARIEAERRAAPAMIRGMNAEMEFKIEDHRFLVDINVECPLDASSDKGCVSDGARS